MQHPETMKVIYKGWPDIGPVIINKDAFDQEKHELIDPAPAVETVPKKRGRPRKSET